MRCEEEPWAYSAELVTARSSVDALTKKFSKVSALEQSLYKSHYREYFREQMPLIPFSYYWVHFHTIGLRDMHMEITIHLRLHMENTIYHSSHFRTIGLRDTEDRASPLPPLFFYLSSHFRTIGLRDTERDTKHRASPLPPGSPRLRA
jgi:hypothetical protein